MMNPIRQCLTILLAIFACSTALVSQAECIVSDQGAAFFNKYKTGGDSHLCLPNNGKEICGTEANKIVDKIARMALPSSLKTIADGVLSICGRGTTCWTESGIIIPTVHGIYHHYVSLFADDGPWPKDGSPQLKRLDPQLFYCK